MSPIDQQMNSVSINLLEIGDKARSKSELYRILTVEGALYLPPYKFWSVDFMADKYRRQADGESYSFIVLQSMLYRPWNQRKWRYVAFRILKDWGPRTCWSFWLRTAMLWTTCLPNIPRSIWIVNGLEISVLTYLYLIYR